MGPGVFITYSYKLEGDTMWVTQERNQNGPFANPVTFKSVRVELLCEADFFGGRLST